MKRVSKLFLFLLAAVLLLALVPGMAFAEGEGAVTRAEWVSALVDTFSMTVEGDDYPDNYYSDLSEENEHYRDILVAVEFGVIELDAGEAFEPDAPATHAFAQETLVYCLGFQPEAGEAYTGTAAEFAAEIAAARGWFAAAEPAAPLTTAEKETLLADAAGILAADEFDESHENNCSFAEGVKVFPEETEIAEGENGELYIYDTETALQTGDLFVVYYGDLPIGFKALSVTDTEDCHIVTATTEGAEDAVQDLDYEGSIEADLESFVPAEAETRVLPNGMVVEAEATQAHLMAEKTISTKKEIEASKTFKIRDGLKVTVTGTLKNIELNLRLKWKDYRVTVDADTVITATASGSLQDALGYDSITLGEVPFCYGAGRVSLDFVYDLSGNVTLAWDGHACVGFAYTKDDGFRMIRSYQKKAFTITAEINAKAGLKLDATIGFDGLGGGIWAEVGAQAQATGAWYDSGTPKNCIDLKAWLYCKMGGWVKFPIVGEFSDTKIIYDYSNSPAKLHYHWEDGHEVPDCTRGADFEKNAGKAPSKYHTPSSSRHYNPGSRHARGSGTGSGGETIPIWTYSLDEARRATITGYSGGGATLTVPETIDGYTVIAIGQAAFKGKNVYCVTIPDTVTSIGRDAFMNCSNLRTLLIPDSVTVIAREAFAGTGLRSLDLPANLTFLGYRVLGANTGVTELTIPKSLETAEDSYWNGTGGPLTDSAVKTLRFEEGRTLIPAHMAAKAWKLTNLILPQSLKVIGEDAFGFCSSLKTVTVPQLVEELGAYAFHDCTSLNAITLPENLLAVRREAFATCTSLETIALPDTVTAIGREAFIKSGLKSLKLPASLTLLGYRVLGENTGVTELTIPKSLETAEDSYWSGTGGPLTDSAVTTLRFEEGRTLIPAHMAAKAWKLTDVTLPQSLTAIGEDAFGFCSALETITIPPFVTELGAYAFHDCTVLKKIDLPENLLTVRREAFATCMSLETIALPDTVTAIGREAFIKSGLKSLKLPASLTFLGYRVLGENTGVTELTIPKSLETAEDIYWSGSGGPLTDSAVTTLRFEEGRTLIPAHMAAKAWKLTDVTLPETLTAIGEDAFGFCSALETITIPQFVTELGAYAFHDCTVLKEIGLPENLLTVRREAFANCLALETIALPDTVTAIGREAFIKSGLKSLKLPASLTLLGYRVLGENTGVTELTIPKSLETAEDIYLSGTGGPLTDSAVTTLRFEEGRTLIPANMAAKAWKLTSVVLPQSLTAIGEDAFGNCPALPEISLPEKVETVGRYAFLNCYALRSAELSASLMSVGREAFENCSSLTEILLPDAVTAVGDSAFVNCTALEKAQLSAGMTAIAKECFSGCEALKQITLPEEIKTVGENAFKGCAALASVQWNEGLTTIGKEAFMSSGLAEVRLPEGLTSIGVGAFSNCDALTAVTVPDSVTSLGASCFKDSDVLTNVELGFGITVIPASCFEHCDALEAITLPFRVQTVENNAFLNCQSLKEIFIPRNTTAIKNDTFSYKSKMTIFGVAGTYAEQYANQYGIRFEERIIPAESVSISDATLTLLKGQTHLLVMSVSPRDFTDALTWRCSDTNVVTVSDNGTVKAVGLGTATVKLSVGDKSASCKITVVQPVTSIGLNMRSVTLEALDTFQLIATVKPTDAYDTSLKWSSSDESVFTVDQTGLITGIGKGEATVTVEALDGSGVKNSIRVVVNSNGVLAHTVGELESPHNYALNCSDFWQYTLEGASGLFVTFDERTNIEDGFDFLYIYDGARNEIGKYTGTELAGQTVEVPGDTVRLRLVSDDAGTEWGFKVSSVEAAGTPGDADGDGEVNVTDVQLVFRYASGDTEAVAEGASLDMNSDGNVNNRDAIILYRKLMGTT